ncbi:TfoX/Sxy family protein [Nitratireductor aquimarinus]|uniref:TfoX/Sxy family protein n=1 Tax=Alphaproteobacteria TaxID=28211 RepID=UPI0019D3DD2A|nr:MULTISPECIES: TfoX/Sxy family protein [Alphaproteobacteria]MBN7778131.1 TfoX/Sxy family protein [Nitratireductor pacificus]MBY6021021.1 TfoX/Sxy family protein [Nitratireductor sp. DP7N14-4]MBN7756235.1 TfoX/Sxy family protein [Nitratireductor aquimarinus]MBN7782453.1 TfoX/Sxy family protein [Nitratireductor pacificus]MBN7791260.1 TfoX/Sxy family protein [Nitratireductor aquimarinus]
MDDDAIHDLFAGLGPVSIKRMFGGKGIYHQGVVFALEVSGEILLKADAESAADFAEAGCRQWVYEGHKGRGPVAMPYWSIPDAALDDPDEMALWAQRAFQAGLRSRKR